MKKFDITKTRVYILISFIGICIPLAAYLDIPTIRPAWSYEVNQLREEQAQIGLDFYQDSLRDTEYEKLKLEREKEQILKEEGSIPEVYIREQNLLESKIGDLKIKVDSHKNRLLQLEEE